MTVSNRLGVVDSVHNVALQPGSVLADASLALTGTAGRTDPVARAVPPVPPTATTLDAMREPGPGASVLLREAAHVREGRSAREAEATLARAQGFAAAGDVRNLTQALRAYKAHSADAKAPVDEGRVGRLVAQSLAKNLERPPWFEEQHGYRLTGDRAAHIEGEMNRLTELHGQASMAAGVQPDPTFGGVVPRAYAEAAQDRLSSARIADDRRDVDLDLAAYARLTTLGQIPLDEDAVNAARAEGYQNAGRSKDELGT